MSDEERTSGAPTDAERARAIREQLKQVHGFDLAYEMMISLVSFGYQKLGLTDETRELRDLDDARTAIELLRATLEVVEKQYGREKTRDVRSTLAQLQIAYAQAVQLSGGAPAERPAAPGPAAAAAEPAVDPAEEPAPAPERPAAKKPAAAKPAAKQAAKKPAARKPAVKKAAPKKPAAKKPAPRKPRGSAGPTG